MFVDRGPGIKGIGKCRGERKSPPVRMAKIIIEPKKTKDGQVEFTVDYQDKKTDNNFTLTITNSLDEAMERTRVTLEAEAQAMLQKK
jgi:hypothetical protein